MKVKASLDWVALIRAQWQDGAPPGQDGPEELSLRFGIRSGGTRTDDVNVDIKTGVIQSAQTAPRGHIRPRDAKPQALPHNVRIIAEGKEDEDEDEEESTPQTGPGIKVNARRAFVRLLGRGGRVAFRLSLRVHNGHRKGHMGSFDPLGPLGALWPSGIIYPINAVVAPGDIASSHGPFGAEVIADLYHRGVHIASGVAPLQPRGAALLFLSPEATGDEEPSTPANCCCCLPDGVVCRTHIAALQRAAQFIASSPRPPWGPEALAKTLQLLHFLLGGDAPHAEIYFCDAHPAPMPSAAVRFAVKGKRGRGAPLGHSFLKHGARPDPTRSLGPPGLEEELCPTMMRILFARSSILRPTPQRGILIKIPADFKIIQLLAASSLSGVILPPQGSEETVAVGDTEYSYAQINAIVFQYFSQIATDPGCLPLILRFTDFGRPEQRDRVAGLLEAAQEAPPPLPAAALELLSPDFAGLPHPILAAALRLGLRGLGSAGIRRYPYCVFRRIATDSTGIIFDFVAGAFAGDEKFLGKLFFFLQGPSGPLRHAEADAPDLCTRYLAQLTARVRADHPALLGRLNATNDFFSKISEAYFSARDAATVRERTEAVRKLLPEAAAGALLPTRTVETVSALRVDSAYFYKSANRPLIFEVALSPERATRLLVKSSDVSNDALYLQALRIIARALRASKVPLKVPRYRAVNIWANFAVVEFCRPPLQRSGPTDSVAQTAFVCVINYLFAMGDRHRENLVPGPGGPLNVDAAHIFSDPPHVRLFAPFKPAFVLTPEACQAILKDEGSLHSFLRWFVRIFFAVRSRHRLLTAALRAAGLGVGPLTALEQNLLLYVERGEAEKRLRSMALAALRSPYHLWLDRWHSAVAALRR